MFPCFQVTLVAWVMIGSLSSFCLESCKGYSLFMGPKNGGMMGCCLTSRPLICIDNCWYSLCQDRMQWNKLCDSSVWEVTHFRGQNSNAANLSPQGVTFSCFCDWQFHCQSNLSQSSDKTSSVLLGEVACHWSFFETTLSLNYSGQHREVEKGVRMFMCRCVLVCVCICEHVHIMWRLCMHYCALIIATLGGFQSFSEYKYIYKCHRLG